MSTKTSINGIRGAKGRVGLTSILVPVNGDESDEEAVRLACGLVRPSKGKIFALHVIKMERELPVDAEVAPAMARGEEILKYIEELAKGERCEVEAELLQAREVGPAVVQEAVERGVEAIVIGTPYKLRYGSFSLGRTVPYIMKNAPCRVILWRETMAQSNRDDFRTEE